ncbi:MAG: hypothetical protein ICV82_00660 [Nitrososphaera sp.]|nr:hypothetical protein [Nitrososphaera sp.]
MLRSNAHHQLVALPAALSGLLTLPVSVSERPSLIITVPSQGTHMGFAAMLSDETQHQLFVRYSASFSADE